MPMTLPTRLVLTVRQVAKAVPEGEEVRYDGALVSHWVGDQIALWHRDTGEMEVLYNLYDIFDPWSYPNVAEPNS